MRDVLPIGPLTALGLHLRAWEIEWPRLSLVIEILVGIALAVAVGAGLYLFHSSQPAGSEPAGDSPRGGAALGTAAAAPTVQEPRRTTALPPQGEISIRFHGMAVVTAPLRGVNAGAGASSLDPYPSEGPKSCPVNVGREPPDEHPGLNGGAGVAPARDKDAASGTSGPTMRTGTQDVQARGATPAAGPLWRVTAYCPCKTCCGRWADGWTTSRTRADHPLLAAPREIPFGTVLRVPGYGSAKVEDRGGDICGHRLDVLIPPLPGEDLKATHARALAWGVKYLTIESPSGPGVLAPAESADRRPACPPAPPPAAACTAAPLEVARGGEVREEAP